MLRMFAALAVAALWCGAPAGAQEWLKAKDLPAAPVLPIKAFAQLGRMVGPDVSPDGAHLAYITSMNGRKNVAIKNLATQKIVIVKPPIAGFEFRWVGWANNERLLVGLGFESDRGTVSVAGNTLEFKKSRETRLVAINVDGGGAINMIKPNTVKGPGSNIERGSSALTALEQDRVIDFTASDPDTILLSIVEDYTINNSTAVRKINVKTGEYRTVITGQRDVDSYSTDQQEEVRLAYGSILSGNKYQYFIKYRDPDSKTWLKFDRPQLLEIGTYFIGFMTDPRFGYVLTSVDGRRALAKFNMKTQSVAETIYRDPEVDVSSVYLNEKEDVIGVRLAGSDEKSVFFDPVWKARMAGLESALKGYKVYVTAITRDAKNVLLRATNASEPGIRYLYNVDKKALSELDFDYAGLGPDNAPYRTMIKYKARDGLDIEAVLTLPRGIDPKNLPTIMLPHGGPWANDTVDYDYEAAFLANRGYAVLQPNFRGSTGYGQAFFNKGNNQWGLAMQDDITDGADWLVRNGIADKSRMCIVGGSYGGYAALMGAVKTPDLFKCAVSINGVSDILRLLKDDTGGFKNELTAYLIGDADKDRDRLKATSPYYNAEKITAPVLLIHAKNDRRVDVKQSQRMRDKLKDAGKSFEYVELADGEHFLENETARITYLTAMETFLARNLKK